MALITPRVFIMKREFRQCLYGKVQTAAISARKLRDISPQLYLALYNNNMEMLYFLVSDKIDRALINAIGLRGEERILSVMKSLAY